jgi:hypothetical protein
MNVACASFGATITSGGALAIALAQVEAEGRYVARCS